MADLTGMMQAAAGNAGEAPTGEAIFTDTSGSVSWVVPSGVTSISAVCIGAGGAGAGSNSGGMGGGGGDLRYYNNLAVTPGETLTITVGAGGIGVSTSGTAGGFSLISRSGTTLLEAAGGGGGSASGTQPKNGTSTTIAGDVGGGDGGVCGDGSTSVSGGGGGAGGYAGNGGDGAFGVNVGANGAASSGAGGGGGGGGSSSSAGRGGGVNVFGIGLTGEGGSGASLDGSSATGGSYGDGGLNYNLSLDADAKFTNRFGGGGNGADNTSGEFGVGSDGAVRIVWPGDARSFPSTDVWMSRILTTVIETQATGNITIPASAQVGDLAILMYAHQTSKTPVTPSGFTQVTSINSLSLVLFLGYRIIQSGDAGTTVSIQTGTNKSVEMILLRKAAGTISSVSVSGAAIQATSAKPTNQVQSASTATGPFVVFGAFSTETTQIGTGDLLFFGGVAGSGNLEPSYSYSGGNGDVTRQAFMRFRIYDEAPATDVSVVANRDVVVQAMASFIIEVT